MRIAICIPRLPLSGVGTSVGVIHDGLKEADHEVDVLITGHCSGGDLSYALASGWKIILAASGERFLRKRLEATLGCIQRVGYDVVLNNTSIETQLVLPCLPEKTRRVCVMRVLNASALRHVALNSAHADTVVGISQEMVRVLREDRRVRAPVKLIPNCTRVTGGEFPRLGGRVEVCYLGRLSLPDKNVLILPEIARHLKHLGVDFRLRIAGEGPATGQLRRRVAQLGLCGIEFCGAVSRGEATEILRTSQFCLLPSVSEGLSNVMLECMALGCLPVCSDIENFKWVLGDVAGQLQCRLREPKDYAERLLSLKAQAGDYSSLQRYLRARQEAEFTPARTIRGYMDLLAMLSPRHIRPHHPVQSLGQVHLPLKYQVWCSPVWRWLQTIRHAIRETTHS